MGVHEPRVYGAWMVFGTPSACKTGVRCGVKRNGAFFAASRAQLGVKQFRPAIQKGLVVVSNRFSDSTSYQGIGRGLEVNYRS